MLGNRKEKYGLRNAPQELEMTNGIDGRYHSGGLMADQNKIHFLFTDNRRLDRTFFVFYVLFLFSE